MQDLLNIAAMDDVVYVVYYKHGVGTLYICMTYSLCSGVVPEVSIFLSGNCRQPSKGGGAP